MENEQNWKKVSQEMSAKLRGNIKLSRDKEDAPLSEMLSSFDEVFRKKAVKDYADYLKNNKGYEEYLGRMIRSDFFADNVLKDSDGLILALFMADEMPNIFQHKWPFSEKDLNQIMQVMGR